MPTNSTPASQPSPEMRVNKAHPERARLCATCEHEGAPDNVHPCNCCWNPLGDMYRRRVVPIAPAEQHSPNSETGRRVFDDPHGRVAARYPVQPSPAPSDMPQECEDCGRSMTRCACSPARSDKDVELSPCPFCGAHLPHMWSLTLDGKEHSITCTECPGRAVFKSSSREQAIAAWNRRAAKAQESAPSSERCAECGLGCAPGVCIYGAANEITDVLGLFARRATAGTTAAPSSEVSFDAFWSDEVARNGGHGFGADYKHWARKGFDAARRATAGTTAPKQGEAHRLMLAAGFACAYDKRTGVHTYTGYIEDAERALAGATAAPSGESIDISKLTRWTFDGGMSAEARKDGQWVSFSDLEVLARRATAGTTAAPSAYGFAVEWPNGKADVFKGAPKEGMGEYWRGAGAEVVPLFRERATAGTTAPTEALTDKEICGSHEYSITRDKGCFRAGALWARNWIAKQHTPAATAAPGDLPREWVQKTWFDCNQDVFAFTREVLARNAGAAPGWQTVPKEPTEAMVHAAEDLPAPRMFAKVYRAMLAAAPSNPPVGAHESERKAP